MAELLTGDAKRSRTGRIYIIQSPNTNMVYIGSTFESLKKRFSRHLSDWKTKDRKQCPTSLLILDKGDSYIELLEEVQVESKRELEMIEQQYIDSIPNTVNKMRPYVSEEEQKENKKIWQKTHREEHRKACKKYRDTHKQKMSEYEKTHREERNEKKREQIRCEVCDCLINKSSKTRHKSTKKHISNSENVAQQ